MNERIKELANKAGCDYLYDYSEDGHAVVCNLSDIEKFAKSIIQECLKIIEPTEDSGDEWCVTLKGAAEEIKEHFGV
jgi:hypothetical protein